MDALMLLIFGLPVLGVMILALRRWIRTVRAMMQRNWASVPPPIWAAKRGGRDYW
jgi:hypothetical protein